MQKYYKRLRQRHNALEAFKLAKKWQASGKSEYNIPATNSIYYNPPCKNGEGFVENVSNGLRFKGYADEINRFIDHKGWYCDDVQCESLRGVVYQLPARKGKERFIYGYADPYNDDCAFLVFDIIEDEEYAARLADSVTEEHAEEQRGYNEAYFKGAQYAELKEEAIKERKKCLALIAAIKIERGRGASEIICSTLRKQVQRHIATIKSCREQAEALAEACYSWQAQAFNEGAGYKIIKE